MSQQRKVVAVLLVIALAAVIVIIALNLNDSDNSASDYNQVARPTPSTSSTPTPSSTPSEESSPSPSENESASEDLPIVAPTDNVSPPQPHNATRLTSEEIQEYANVTPEGMNPDQLVHTAAHIMSSWDTTSDTSRTDGYRRALNLFIDDFDEIFTAPEKPTFTEGWMKAYEYNATSYGWTRTIDKSEDGDTISYRVTVMPIWVGEGNWSQYETSQNWTFVVEPDGDDWIISNFSEGRSLLRNE